MEVNYGYKLCFSTQSRVIRIEHVDGVVMDEGDLRLNMLVDKEEEKFSNASGLWRPLRSVPLSYTQTYLCPLSLRYRVCSIPLIAHK